MNRTKLYLLSRFAVFMALIPALAGADPPGSEAAHIASEPALQALLGGLVIVRLQDGEELQGVLLSFDAQVGPSTCLSGGRQEKFNLPLGSCRCTPGILTRSAIRHT